MWHTSAEVNRNQVSGEVLASPVRVFNKKPAAHSVSTTTELSSTAQAFDVLEAVLSTPAKTIYRRRMEENFDVDGSPTFTAWKLFQPVVEVR